MSKTLIRTETTVSSEVNAATLDKAKAEALIAEFNQAKSAIKALEAQQKAAEKALREMLGDSEIGLIDGVERVKIASRTRRDINKDDLKAAFPEAYEMCLKETTYTVLTAVS